MWVLVSVTYGIYVICHLIEARGWKMGSLKSSGRKYLSCISMGSRVIYVHPHYHLAASRRPVSRLQPVTNRLSFSPGKPIQDLTHLLHPPPDEIHIRPLSLWSWGRRVWVSLTRRRMVAVRSNILRRALLFLRLLQFLLLWIPLLGLRSLLPCQTPLLTPRQGGSCDCCCTGGMDCRWFLRYRGP